MNKNRVKLFVISTFALPLLTLATFNTNIVSAGAKADDDTANTYKTKCQMCHSPKAEKFFDASKSADTLKDVILNGKSDSKPPMPSFKAKGMTDDQAKALADYMKSLRTPSN